MIARPEPLKHLTAERIPDQLRRLKTWVGFRLAADQANGKWKKPPASPVTGEPIGGVEKYREHFLTFEEALAGVRRYELDGVGIVILAESGLIAVDFDHCIDDNGNLDPVVKAWLQWLPSYKEISISGKGIHVICRGKINRALAVTPLPDAKNGATVEIYKDARFFTVSGNRAGDTSDVADCQLGLDKLLTTLGASSVGAADKQDEHLPTETSLDDAVAYLNKTCDAFAGMKDGRQSAATAKCFYLGRILGGLGYTVVENKAVLPAGVEQNPRFNYELVVGRLKLSLRQTRWDPAKFEVIERQLKEGIAQPIKIVEKDAVEESLELRCFADIEVKPIEWLWRDRIPRAKQTYFFGEPDKGKSLTALDIIAHHTTGKPWPDGAPSTETGDALILSSEDNPEDTIKPRLLAAGANVSRVHLVEKVKIRQGAKQAERDFALDTDLALLSAKLEANPKITLVVIDPVTSYLGRANMNKEQELRRVLTPIKDMAERLNVTVICIGHFNKRIDVNALQKAGGAAAMTGVPRAVWGFVNDPAKNDEYLMLLLKGNITKKRTGLRYRIAERQVDGLKDGIPYIDWQKGDVIEQADTVLDQSRDTREKRSVRAERFLLDYLADGPKKSEDVKAEGKKQGISHNALWDAKRELGVESVGKGNDYSWRLPKKTETTAKQADMSFPEKETSPF